MLSRRRLLRAYLHYTNVIPMTVEQLCSRRFSACSAAVSIGLNRVVANEEFRLLNFLCYFDQHLIVSDFCGSCLHVIDEKTLRYVKCLHLYGKMGEMTGVCANEDRLYACDQQNCLLYMFDRSYQLLKEVPLTAYDSRLYETLVYSTCAKRVFLMDFQCSMITAFDSELRLISDTRVYLDDEDDQLYSMNAIGNRIYVIVENHERRTFRIQVHDMTLSYIAKFQSQEFDKPVEILAGACFLYVWNRVNAELYVFNENHRFLNVIAFSDVAQGLSRATVVGKQLLVISDHNKLAVFKASFSGDMRVRSYRDYEKDYLCAQHHILKEPHKLPCGINICLNCIYTNYNTEMNTLRCKCAQREHSLSGCKINRGLSDKFQDSLEAITCEAVQYGHKLVNELRAMIENKREHLDKIAEFNEYQIEVHFESLYQQLDEFQNKALASVRRLERRVRKIDRNTDCLAFIS